MQRPVLFTKLNIYFSWKKALSQKMYNLSFLNIILYYNDTTTKITFDLNEKVGSHKQNENSSLA